MTTAEQCRVSSRTGHAIEALRRGHRCTERVAALEPAVPASTRAGSAAALLNSTEPTKPTDSESLELVIVLAGSQLHVLFDRPWRSVALGHSDRASVTT